MNFSGISALRQTDVISASSSLLYSHSLSFRSRLLCMAALSPQPAWASNATSQGATTAYWNWWTLQARVLDTSFHIYPCFNLHHLGGKLRQLQSRKDKKETILAEHACLGLELQERNVIPHSFLLSCLPCRDRFELLYSGNTVTHATKLVNNTAVKKMDPYSHQKGAHSIMRVYTPYNFCRFTTLEEMVGDGEAWSPL